MNRVLFAFSPHNPHALGNRPRTWGRIIVLLLAVCAAPFIFMIPFAAVAYFVKPCKHFFLNANQCLAALRDDSSAACDFFLCEYEAFLVLGLLGLATLFCGILYSPTAQRELRRECYAAIWPELEAREPGGTAPP